MPTFQEDLTVDGDIFMKQNNYVSCTMATGAG